MGNKYVRSPIFYMGSKFKLLKTLIPLFPSSCGTFVDLFGGSGCLCMNYKGERKTIYNEINPNIIELVKMIVGNDPNDLDKYFKEKIKYYGLREKSDKINKGEGKENYNKMRSDYNNSQNRDYRDLYLLMCYSINRLLRFNSKNEFNASNGNDGYNETQLVAIQNMHETFKNILISNNDALSLDLDKLEKDSFVYMDPPYLNTEAVYNEKRAFGGWNIDHDLKLFEILEKADKKGIKWGLSNVFENRGVKNQHLIDWCNKNGWQVYHLDRQYNPFSTSCSNSDEVYICNYKKE